MIFNSFQFIWLFPLIFLVYWVAERFNRPGFKWSKAALLIVSYGVYIQWSVVFALILLLVTAVTYSFARFLEYASESRRKAVVWVGAILSLSPLLLFKYYNFITGAGASVLQWIGIDAAPPALTWVVPLGLSFYTFQALGYLCDVYRGKIAAERNWWTYMLFVSYFPQLLCGPISTAQELLPQLRKGRSFDYAKAVRGLRMILWGMFLKVVVADRLGLYVNVIYADFNAFSGSSSLLAAVFYSIQIYGDFAGYSYIAVGISRLLNIDLIINFRRPYFAQSVSGFWKRWNISLTRWLTTNIYIPLGGSREGKLKTYANIMTTFLVSGVWHGANWTFIFWGILHGAAQCIEKFLGLNKLESQGFMKILRIVVTFIIVTVAWIYFRSPSVEFANNFICHIFSSPALPYIDTNTFMHVFPALAIVFAVESIMEFKPFLSNRILTSSAIIRWGAYTVLTLMIIGFGVLDSSQFIYIQF